MISFTLLPRQSSDGRVAIVLHLYRNQTLVSTTTVATVERVEATMVLLECRVHLRNLGVKEGGATAMRSAR